MDLFTKHKLPSHYYSYICAWVSNKKQTRLIHFSVSTPSPPPPSGVWWPCAIQYLESGISSFHFDIENRHLVVGTALGQVLLYTVPRDYNALDMVGKVQGISFVIL
jgi:hypothetical protein